MVLTTFSTKLILFSLNFFYFGGTIYFCLTFFFFFSVRINALVDQEVKRTLFKERVKREKQRLVERENDRQERHQELSKIKQAHNREIAKLREKYEAK